MTDFIAPAGAWPILLTAFDERDRLDLPPVGALLDFYDGLGIPGVLALGQASEMLLLSDEERFRVAELCDESPPWQPVDCDRRQLRRNAGATSAQPGAHPRNGRGCGCGGAGAAAISR